MVFWWKNFQQLFSFVLIFEFLGILWAFFLVQGLSFLSEQRGVVSLVDGGGGDSWYGSGVSCFSSVCALSLVSPSSFIAMHHSFSLCSSLPEAALRPLVSLTVKPFALHVACAENYQLGLRRACAMWALSAGRSLLGVVMSVLHGSPLRAPVLLLIGVPPLHAH